MWSFTVKLLDLFSSLTQVKDSSGYFSKSEWNMQIDTL